jgi:hypothetical protein
MHSVGIVSTLAEQMVLAKARIAQAQAGGKDARAIESIDRSLRQTLCCLVQIRDPRELATHGFSLVVKSTGEALVRHKEWTLPVSDSYLRSLMSEAGVELVPGQVLLLDAVLVTMLVEEALGAISLEEAQIHGAKSRLIQASLEVESQMTERPRPAEGDSAEAA